MIENVRDLFRRPRVQHVLVGIVGLVFAHLVIGELAVTGDEPRYLYYAYSFFASHGFSAPAEGFRDAMMAHGGGEIGITGLSTLVHSVVHPVLGSAAVYCFGVAGARWFVFAVGCVGFVATLELSSLRLSARASFGVALLVYLSIPVLPYLRLFYAETWLMTLCAWSLYLASRPETDRRAVLGSVALALCLPFFHVRMALVAASLVLFSCTRLLPHARRPSEARRTLALLLTASLVAGAAFVAYQHGLYGSLTGSASPVVQPGFAAFPRRIAVQMLDFRHGLLVYNPSVVLALAGLAIGAWKRDRVACLSALLLLVYLVSFVWGAASESYPARFWVAIMPVFVVGYGFWFRDLRSPFAIAVSVVLIALSASNALLFLERSMLFLENRQASLTYDLLFTRVPIGNFSTWLPWDTFNYTAFGIAPHEALSDRLALWASAFVVLLVSLLVLGRLTSRGRAFDVVAVVLCLFAAEASTMRRIPVRTIEASHAYDAATRRGSIVLRLCGAVEVAALRLHGLPRALMIPPRYPRELLIEGTTDGRTYHELVRAPVAPVLRVPVEPVRAIRISGTTEENDPSWTTISVTPLSRGVLRACR